MEGDLNVLNAVNIDCDIVNDIYNQLPKAKRYIRAASNPFEFYTNDEFKKLYRFEKNTVLDCIMPLINWPNVVNNRGLPLPPVVCADLRSISQSSVCRSVIFLSRQIAAHCQHYIRFPSEADFFRSRQMFYEIAQFPDVTGCIDCTHVKIQNPGGPYAEVFRNRKRYFSINVQVVCGPNLEIFDIVARWPGREHDSIIYNNSSVKMKFERGDLRGYLLGDSGYSCLTYLMIPVDDPVTPAANRYNRSHIRTRNTIERMFGVWKRRFPCLSKGLNNKPETCCNIIVACAILYNIGKAANDDFLLKFDENNEAQDDPHFQVPNNDIGFYFRRALIRRHFQN